MEALLLRTHCLAVIAIAGAMLVPACGRTQAAQDSSDQAALRRLFGLPRGAELLSYDGYPSQVGFGQREGLSLSAEYRLADDDMGKFLRSAVEAGWQPLPMPVGLSELIPFHGLSVPWDAADGLYRCQTAGDDVLHARRTTSCLETTAFHDVILGVFDAASQRVWVTVRSAY